MRNVTLDGTREKGTPFIANYTYTYSKNLTFQSRRNYSVSYNESIVSYDTQTGIVKAYAGTTYTNGHGYLVPATSASGIYVFH